MNTVLFTRWLAQQCHMISGAVQALLLTGPPETGPYDRLRCWPDSAPDPSLLTPIAHAALHNKKAVVQPRHSTMANTGEPLDALACPLFVEGQLIGAVAIALIHRPEVMQRAAVQQVQAGGKWLETMLLLDGAGAKAQLLHLVEMVAAALEQDRFQVAATEVANILARQFNCHRASLGFLHRQRIRVAALSHTNRIDHHTALVKAIGDAMGEALDQGSCIALPPPDRQQLQVVRFHELLAEIQQGAAICTLPLVKNGRAVGALLLERSPDTPFDQEDLAQCEQIGLLLGPVLETRRSEERPLPVQVLDTIYAGTKKVFGPRSPRWKTGAALAIGLLTWLALAEGTLRIACDSVLEAQVRQVVAAPQQGFIAKAPVRAGDMVQSGDLLAALDDQELLSEQRKWQSQRAQLLKESRKALAGMDRAEVAILSAKLAQAEAELQLIEQRLARTTLSAPLSGLVVKGDLSQSLGSPVTPGEVLFEVAPSGQYRVVVLVDERDIGLLAPGQQGQLKLSGIPDRAIPIIIQRLTPVASVAAGRNVFRVEAALQWQSDLMRPGMEGVAKIDVGRKKLLWIWSRRLVDWIHLFAWNHLP